MQVVRGVIVLWVLIAIAVSGRPDAVTFDLERAAWCVPGDDTHDDLAPIGVAPVSTEIVRIASAAVAPPILESHRSSLVLPFAPKTSPPVVRRS